MERAKSHHFSERNQEHSESADGEGGDEGESELEGSGNGSSVDKGKGKEAPAHYAPSAEVQAFLFDVLTWRDGIARGVAAGIESIPGLGDLLEQLMDLLNHCAYVLDLSLFSCNANVFPISGVYTLLAPALIVSVCLLNIT